MFAGSAGVEVVLEEDVDLSKRFVGAGERVAIWLRLALVPSDDLFPAVECLLVVSPSRMITSECLQMERLAGAGFVGVDLLGELEGAEGAGGVESAFVQLGCADERVGACVTIIEAAFAQIVLGLGKLRGGLLAGARVAGG